MLSAVVRVACPAGKGWTAGKGGAASVGARCSGLASQPRANVAPRMAVLISSPEARTAVRIQRWPRVVRAQILA
jgi:hypothetical protein